MNAVSSVETCQLTKAIKLSEWIDAQIESIIKSILQLFAKGEDAQKLRPDGKHYPVSQDLEMAVSFWKNGNIRWVRKILEPYIYQCDPAWAVDSEAWVRRMQINDLIGRALFWAILPEMEKKKEYIKPQDYDIEVEKIKVTRLPYTFDPSWKYSEMESDPL